MPEQSSCGKAIIYLEVSIMYCGIDVAKNKSQVCILDRQKNVVSEFEIEHTRQGFEQLELHLTEDMKIGMETTMIVSFSEIESIINTNYP